MTVMGEETRGENLTDDEVFHSTRASLSRDVSAPNMPEMLDAADRERRQQYDAKHCSKRIEEVETGSALIDRLSIADPRLADRLLNRFGVFGPPNLTLTLADTSFGATAVVVKDAHESSIDPTTETLKFCRGIPKDTPLENLQISNVAPYTPKAPSRQSFEKYRLPCNSGEAGTRSHVETAGVTNFLGEMSE